MNNHFADYHPAVVFVYFMSVVALTLVLSQPVFLLLSVAVSFLYTILLDGKKTLRGNLLLLLPVLLFPAILNPLVNHRGDTPLLYVNDRPLTLESLFYGLFVGVMVAAMLFWFQAYSKTLDSDRFLYLFGKRLPTTALLVTMIFRLIPRFRRELGEIAAVQQKFGLDTQSGSKKNRLRAGASVLSVLLSVTLEDSLQTADSMKSRGYGLGRKTSAQRIRFSPRDGFLLTAILFSLGCLCFFQATGALQFSFFPKLCWPQFDSRTAALLILYGLLLTLPLLVNLWEEIRWRFLRSKISPSPIRRKENLPSETSPSQ